MPARIFISCGQRPGVECKFCEDLKLWLETKGYEVYIAIKIQSILDLNSDIIGALRNSDYYLFINFARETVHGSSGDSWKRGSVYTNQELAIAISQDFEHCLFINQKGVRREGIHEYLTSNVPEFETIDELMNITQTAIQTAKWSPSYSRRLVVQKIKWEGPLCLMVNPLWKHLFTPSVAHEHIVRDAKVLHAYIANRRTDNAAFSTIARLATFNKKNNPAQKFYDSSNLKVTSQSQAYSQVIWPEGTQRFDLLTFSVSAPRFFYLHSNHDLYPRDPVIEETGIYHLNYEVIAEKFQVLKFTLEINVDGSAQPKCQILT